MAIIINPNDAFSGSQGASNLNGVLTKAQWNDWITRFKPYVEKQAAIANDEGFAASQGQAAATAVNTSYANTANNLQMSRAGMGLNLTANQKAAEDRKMALGQAADSTNSYNSAQISARDLQDQIIAGAGGLSSIAKGKAQ
jgi:hypothetical protein